MGTIYRRNGQRRLRRKVMRERPIRPIRPDELLYWRTEGKSRFATLASASRAAQRFGPLYDLALIYP